VVRRDARRTGVRRRKVAMRVHRREVRHDEQGDRDQQGASYTNGPSPACHASSPPQVASGREACQTSLPKPKDHGKTAMAHRRPPLVHALALNTAVLLPELLGGVRANSLSLVMDGVHNVSDEIALAMLVVAYTVPAGLSGKVLRIANVFDSVGLLAISGFLVWQAVERLGQPPTIVGAVPLVIGLIAAAGNWAVARALRDASREDPAIRLAYVHNLGDTLMSLAPVAAGILTLVTGRSVFDPILALVVAVAIIMPSVRTLFAFRAALVWPENVRCAHDASG
jgi:cobalt-zinc-cadmium efflux system protein